MKFFKSDEQEIEFLSIATFIILFIYIICSIINNGQA